MTYQVTIPATATFVTVAELKTHLLLFGDTSYDTELQDILLTAEGFVSDFLGEFLAPTTVKIILPTLNDTTLLHKYVTNVVVNYWDADDLDAPVNPNTFTLDKSGVYPRLLFKTKPTSISTTTTNQGSVSYLTSLSPVPSKVKHAILLIAAELFENRNNSTDKKMEKVQLTAMRLMQSLRGW